MLLSNPSWAYPIVLIISKFWQTLVSTQKQHLAKVEQEEKELLEVQSIPMRNYLMRHVMPILTQGLIQVCKVRPEDPIDYLVRISLFLIKVNK